jgi:magnesium transporter
MNDRDGSPPQPRARRRRKQHLSGIRRATAPGAVPGTLTPHSDALASQLDVISYGPDDLQEPETADLDAVEALPGKNPVLWINVTGLGSADLIAGLGVRFGLHTLSLEDVINAHQRPKAEEFKDHAFIVARMPHLDGSAGTEQISLFLGHDFLITFQERPGDCFDAVRERIRQARGRLRKAGPDYLCYALIDSIIDAYFPALERYGEVLEALEDQVVSRPEAAHVHLLHEQKRELLLLRRAIWPHREMVNSLIRGEHPLFTEPTRVYLRDCYDHTIQLMDIVETYREIASGLVDVYISSTSAKLNEIMKVLTIIATIFIPLGFIASLYGMNFDPRISPWNMPELRWYLGYPFALALMAIAAGGLLWYFRRKGWIGGGRDRDMS